MTAVVTLYSRDSRFLKLNLKVHSAQFGNIYYASDTKRLIHVAFKKKKT